MTIVNPKVRLFDFVKSEQQIKEQAQQTGILLSRYVREVVLGALPQDEANLSKYDQIEVLYSEMQ